VDKIINGLPAARAAARANGWFAAARAIMTTDTVPKAASLRVDVDGAAVTVTGIAKGAGMIHPDMATMLSFVATDAPIAAALLTQIAREVADVSFNGATVDGDTSTNDTVLLLASGASGIKLRSLDDEFQTALDEVCRSLAQQIVADGEGVQHVIRLSVKSARNRTEALQVARTVAHSLLVKTAIHGGDPNWGRLIAVAGRAGVGFELNRAHVMIGPIVLFKDGRPYDEAAPEAASYLKNTDVVVSVDLGVGNGSSTVWTCDLSAEYVRINAEYRT